MASVFPSEELRAFLLQLYDALNRLDADALRRMFSAEAHVLAIGTDPEEWWTGEECVEVITRQTRELDGFTFVAKDPMAFSSGNVGWVGDRPTIRLNDGNEVPIRVTAVLTIEDGHWRIVQWHTSIGEVDTISFGQSLTKSIDLLERSARDDHPDVSPAAAPDGTVTIAFTDIESSTVLLDRLGDADFQRMLAWHDRIVRDTAAEYRGYVVKSQGDGFMLAFPSAASALRACVTMRSRIDEGFAGLPIRIRAGLHSGEAIKRDDDFYGRTVVIAARISNLAMGGEILASDLVHALARGLGTFEFGEARTAHLKGLDGEYALHPVLG